MSRSSWRDEQVVWRPVITLSASEMIFKDASKLFMVVEQQNPIVLIFGMGRFSTLHFSTRVP